MADPKSTTPPSSAAVVDSTADQDRRLKTTEEKLAAMEKMHEGLGAKIEEYKKEILEKITIPGAAAVPPASAPAQYREGEKGISLVQLLKDLDILA